MSKFRYEHYLRVAKIGRTLGLSFALYVILYVTFALNSRAIAGLVVLLAIVQARKKNHAAL